MVKLIRESKRNFVRTEKSRVQENRSRKVRNNYKVEKFYTADKQSGTVIDEFDTFQEAEDAIERYEDEDRREGCFTNNFYCIQDSEGFNLDCYYGKDGKLQCRRISTGELVQENRSRKVRNGIKKESNDRNKYWYAIMTDVDDDWGNGTFDYEEAVVMCALEDVARGYSGEKPFIAVIDGGYDANGEQTTDTICIDEKYVGYDDILDLSFEKIMEFLDKVPSWDSRFVDEIITHLCDYYDIDLKDELGDWKNVEECIDEIKEAHRKDN